MKSRSNSLLTVFAFGLAAAALAPRIIRALASGWRPPVVAPFPPGQPAPLAAQARPESPAPAAAAVVVPPVPEPEVEPLIAPPAAMPANEPERPEAAPAAYPWLQPQQPGAKVEPPRQPAEAVAGASEWAPVPPLPPAQLPPAYRPAAEAVPWNQGYQPPSPGAYPLPHPGGDPVSRGWAPPGTYQPPAPIPFPVGGYRPPAAGYAQPAGAVPTMVPPDAGPAFARPPGSAATAFGPGDYGGSPAELEFAEEVPPRSSVRHWLSTITSLIGILLLITVVATLVFVAVAPRALGWQFVVVSGGSMEPTIHLGSVAVMAKVDPKTLKVGDIIMFTDPSQTGRAVTHRIIEVKDNGASFTTRGDANKATDASTVPAENVRGKFLFSIPAAGRFVRWMGTSQGYLVIILVPGIVIIFWELRSLSRGRNKPPRAAGS